MDITYDRNFDTLLFDSIDMLRYSLDHSNDFDFRNTLARSSMINSILLLELSANVCIESLELEKSISNEIDRLPILGKFDFYLRSNFRNKKLERGRIEIEGVRELKKLRDGYVHMKPHKLEWQMEKDGTGTADLDKTNKLNISKNPSGWDGESALKTMQTVHNFLMFFFIEKCKFNPTKVSSLLFSESKVPGKELGPIPHFFKSAKKELLSLGVNLSYIKLALT